MRGDNPLRKMEDTDGHALRVQEIFPTFQGEGPSAGTPAFFIRLAGCNLRCHFCDTDFESNIDNVMRLGEIIESIEELQKEYPHTRLIVLTGGEPLRQNVYPLLRALLHAMRFRVEIETSGTLWPAAMRELKTVDAMNMAMIVSPKTGAIQEAPQMLARAFKYVVGEGDQVVWENDRLVIRSRTQAGGSRIPLWTPPRDDPRPIFFQPRDDGDPVQNQKNIERVVDHVLRHGVRLSYQVHKEVGVA